MSFVHLHVHSEYSLLDGASRITDLAKRAADLGMPALALTDHGVMYGAVDFYRACKAQGVKPIIGCEMYVTGDRFKRETQRDKRTMEDRNAHLTVLARDEVGYRNLIKLTSAAAIEGFYYRPRVDHELLRQHRSGLIGMSACLGGEIPTFVLNNQYDQARRRAEEYREIFGAGNFFLELMDHGMREQGKVNEALVRLAGELKLPLVCSNDSHFTVREHHGAQDVLLCIGTGKTIGDADRMRYLDSLYLKTPAEMQQAFDEYPEAVANTLLIADMCDLKLELGKLHFPHFEVPAGHTLDTYLEFLCRQNLPRRYSHVTTKIEDQLAYELKVMRDKGYAGYFLVVQDFVQYAKQRGILVGPGRGSAAGSIVSYLLGITNIDPLAYGLFFERFLNPERESSPDIDIDFQDDRRDEVLAYVRAKYGEDKVAQIITFGTLKARAAVRDVGRAMGLDLPTVDKVAKLIPQNPINYISIEKGIELVPELRELYHSDSRIRELLDTARNIEGLTRHASVHACGTVISHQPLVEICPLQPIDVKDPKSGLMTQYHAKCVEAIGLLKMDFLGLDFSTVISETIKRVQERHGLAVDIDAIPLDDKKTYDMLSRGDGIGVFQLESAGMRKLLKELKPDRFEHVVPLVALYRPGPMDEIPRFVAGRHGGRITYLHPKLKPILQETFGVLLYQEQVMRAAVELAGFTPSQAELLMRAMSKKQVEKMKQIKESFIQGCVAREVKEEIAQQIWDRMETFSGYGFNKSHSAAYGLIAYQTAYLKANYPHEFMASRLTSLMDNSARLVAHIEDTRKMGIEVLLPDVNESERTFTVIEDRGLKIEDRAKAVSGPLRSSILNPQSSIRFGLLGIKTVGDNVVNAIIEARKAQGKFEDLFDFCEKVPVRTVTKSVIETLIKCGAFDSLQPNRAQALAVVENAIMYAEKLQREAADKQLAMAFDSPSTGDKYRPALPNVPDVPKEQRLAWEKEFLGLFLSDHPLSALRDALRDHVDATTDQLSDLKERDHVALGGIITNIRKIMDRSGRPMMFLTMEDFTGEVEVVVFASVYDRCAHLQRDDAVVVRGHVNFVTTSAQKRNSNANGRNGNAVVNEEGEVEEAVESHEMPKIIAQEIICLKELTAPEASASGARRASPVPARRDPRSVAADDQFGMPSDADVPFVANDLPTAMETAPAVAQSAIGNPQSIHLRVKQNGAGKKILSDVQSLLLRHRGATPVVLHVIANDRETKLQLSDQFAVRDEQDFRAEVSKLLGADALWME